jgi:hypothetical protein
MAGLAMGFVGCQMLEDETPTEPTPATEPSPLAIPVVLPTPAPTPTATPAPTPSPTPTPSTPTGSCKLPASNPSNPKCTDDPAKLYADVDAALTALTKARPDIFDFNDKKCENCYYVKNVDAYINQAVKQLNARGVCALYDGEEMAVKDSNTFSEQYDILVASGHMRRGEGSYRGVCKPALF